MGIIGRYVMWTLPLSGENIKMKGRFDIRYLPEAPSFTIRALIG